MRFANQVGVGILHQANHQLIPVAPLRNIPDRLDHLFGTPFHKAAHHKIVASSFKCLFKSSCRSTIAGGDAEPSHLKAGTAQSG